MKTMNRRQALKFGATGLAVVALAPIPLSLEGCTSSEITSYVNTILNGAVAVLKVAEADAPWVPQMQAAIAALETAEASWTAGGAVAILEDALNTVAAVCAVIPLTAVYSPLIDIIVAAVETVLALLPAPAGVALVNIHTNPHAGRVVLAKPSFLHPTHEGAIKAQWNLVAVGPLAAAHLS